MTRIGRLAAAVAFVSAVGGCRGNRPGADQTNGERGIPADAGTDARPAAGSPPNNGPADDALPEASDEMAVRARHLLEAIANDNGALASDILFPRDAWREMRDVNDSGKDWERRVSTPFRTAVHALFRRHEDLARARFASLELGSAVAQATPSTHGWKKALWIVHGSRLTFVVDGRTRTLPVRELTGWRGAWYVTRLR